MINLLALLCALIGGIWGTILGIHKFATEVSKPWKIVAVVAFVAWLTILVILANMHQQH